MVRIQRNLALATAAVVAAVMLTKIYGNSGVEREAVLQIFENISYKLGKWAIPAYVGIHTLTLALCLPYAIFLEAAASLLFGFLPGLMCVFSAKVLAASLSFCIGRVVFRRWEWAMGWAKRSKYFKVVCSGVERDGWRFVLLARFSPIPSYIINYALSATKVRFFVDFLPPTAVGCVPMILQNISIGSLAGAAVASTSSSASTTTTTSRLSSFLFPAIGIGSSILISMRIRKYSSRVL